MSCNDSNDVLIDTSTADIVYIGRAARNTGTDVAKWQIKKIDTTGDIEIVSWADNSDRFEKVWDDRATYTYRT